MCEIASFSLKCHLFVVFLFFSTIHLICVIIEMAKFRHSKCDFGFNPAFFARKTNETQKTIRTNETMIDFSLRRT